MTFNTALSFPLSVFSSVITSYERYIYRKVIDMISTVAAPVFNLIALYLGYASVGMALTTTILQFIMLPLNIGYCFRALKIVPKFGKVSLGLLREMLGFSFYAFIGTLVDLLFWSTDKVILGMLTSSTIVAIYNVGGTFNNIVINLSTSITGVLTPKITVFDNRTSYIRLYCFWTKFYLSVGRSGLCRFLLDCYIDNVSIMHTIDSKYWGKYCDCTK